MALARLATSFQIYLSLSFCSMIRYCRSKENSTDGPVNLLILVRAERGWVRVPLLSSSSHSDSMEKMHKWDARVEESNAFLPNEILAQTSIILKWHQFLWRVAKLYHLLPGCKRLNSFSKPVVNRCAFMILLHRYTTILFSTGFFASLWQK